MNMKQQHTHLYLHNAVCPNCKKNFQPKYYGKERYQKYCSKSCSVYQQHKRGEIGFEKFNPRWNGGVHFDKGYKMIYLPNHPLAQKDGYIYEHRLVAQDRLFTGLIVHHRNHNKVDNRPENLEVLTRAEHNKGHIKEVKA